VETLDVEARLPTYIRYRFDPDDVGIQEQWPLVFRPEPGWEFTSTTSSARSTKQGRKWSHNHNDVPYGGTVWYQIRVNRPEFVQDRGDVIFFPAAEGRFRAWVDGVETPVLKEDKKGRYAMYIRLAKDAPADIVVVLRMEIDAGKGGILRPMWLMKEPPEILRQAKGTLIEKE
jgi:hypothetical protein